MFGYLVIEVTLFSLELIQIESVMLSDLGETLIVVRTDGRAIVFIYIAILLFDTRRAERPQFLFIDVLSTMPASGTPHLPAVVDYTLLEVDTFAHLTVGALDYLLSGLMVFVDYLMDVRGERLFYFLPPILI